MRKWIKNDSFLFLIRFLFTWRYLLLDSINCKDWRLFYFLDAFVFLKPWHRIHNFLLVLVFMIHLYSRFIIILAAMFVNLISKLSHKTFALIRHLLFKQGRFESFLFFFSQAGNNRSLDLLRFTLRLSTQLYKQHVAFLVTMLL